MPQVTSRGTKMVWGLIQDQPKKLFYWYVLGLRTTPPPDIFKQHLVQKLGKQFNIDTFIETGTYKGDMTAAAAKTFRKVYSIELNKGFYAQAIERFKGNNRVNIIFGDSGQKIAELLPQLSGPAVFWLDAHGGEVSREAHDSEDGPAPLVAEIESILHGPRAEEHLILVDDVHTFMRNVKWGRGVWQQLEGIKETWLATHPDWMWQVKDNVLRIYKKRS